MRELILVTGAAGKTGQAVVRKLSREGRAVRALVRRGAQVQELLALGATEAPVGDLLSDKSIQDAVSNCIAVYHICPNVHPEEVTIGLRMVHAASSLGVNRFVYHSVLEPHIEAMPHHWKKRRVEEILVQSNLDFTILQPAVYMQNLLNDWRTLVDNGVYRRPFSVQARLSFVDIENVASVAARVLCEEGHGRAIYELCGTLWLDGEEIAEILTQVLSCTVTAEVQSLAAWQESARASGMPRYQRETLSAMFQYYDRHGLGGSPAALRHLLRTEPTTLREFVGRQAETWSEDSH